MITAAMSRVLQAVTSTKQGNYKIFKSLESADVEVFSIKNQIAGIFLRCRV